MTDFKNYDTPCYLIHLKKFEENCRKIMTPFSQQWSGRVEFGYSVKTNRDANLIRYAAEHLGWYVETVSPNEYEYAHRFVTPERMILNGPCKGDTLLTAYEKGSIINLDHMAEVEMLCHYLAEHPKRETEVGIRVNFDLESLCPGETTAGKEVSRFGICYENGDFGRAVFRLKEAGIAVSGIHLHTSTKSRSAGVFTMLARKAVELAKEYQLGLQYIDMGGGFFGGQKVAGKPSMEEYAACICGELKKGFAPEETRLILEPGASVIATSVEYMTRVLNTRDIRGERVVTLDGTLLHINPFMSHRTPPYRLVQEAQQFKALSYRNSSCGLVQQEEGNPSLASGQARRQLVCGCTCMENDRFLTAEGENPLKAGDIFLFQNAGAYTEAFNSEFILALPKVYVVPEGSGDSTIQTGVEK